MLRGALLFALGLSALLAYAAPPSAVTDLRVAMDGDSLLLNWSRPLLDTLGEPTTVLDFQLYGSNEPNLPAATRLLLAITTDTCATVVREGELGFFQVRGNNGPSLHGTVTRLFTMEEIDDESPIAGATVSIDASSATTDSLGRYYLSLEAPGQYQVTVDHPDFFQRITYAEVLGALAMDINLVPSAFPMVFFDAVVRTETYDQPMNCTVRWQQEPTFYIDNGPAFGSGTLPTEDQVGYVVDIVANLIPSISSNFINEPLITTGNNPPSQGSVGVVVFHWVDSGSIYGGSTLWENELGLYHTRATVRTNTPLNGVYLRNIAGTIGFSFPWCNDYTPSIFNYVPFLEPAAYQPIDYLMGKVLYSRPSGSMTPDTDPNPW